MQWHLPSSRRFAAHLRLALLLLVLATMGMQQLVAQTHWHAVPGAHARVVASTGDSGSRPDDDCLLCRIAAHAGGVAPPAEARLFKVTRGLVTCVATYCAADVPAVPSHAWQSRGPPVT